MSDLKIYSFTDLYELRELWSKCWADWYRDVPGFGAQTMFVKENKLKGIFSDKKLAEEVSSRRAKTIRNVLKKGDVYDQDRIFGKHNVYSTDGSNEWDLHLFKLRVPTSQLEEKNGVIYWKRPLVKFLDYDQPVGDISTLWVLEDIENEPARKIQVNKTLRSRILKI